MQAEKLERAPRVALEGPGGSVLHSLAASELRAIAQRDLSTDGESDVDDQREWTELERQRLGAAHMRMARTERKRRGQEFSERMRLARLAADARAQAVGGASGPAPRALTAAQACADSALPALDMLCTTPTTPRRH